MTQKHDEIKKGIVLLHDTIVEQCIIFASKGGFPPDTDYKDSHDGTLTAIIMAFGKIVAGTLGDVEEVLDIVHHQLRGKEFRNHVARERKTFLDNLADSGRSLKVPEPSKGLQ